MTAIGHFCCCCVERRVVTWDHHSTVVLAQTGWLESLLHWWGRVVVVVHCSAVECDDWSSQRLTRDLHCLTTSEEATRRQSMNTSLVHSLLLRSPTHTVSLANKRVSPPSDSWTLLYYFYYYIPTDIPIRQLGVLSCCSSSSDLAAGSPEDCNVLNRSVQTPLENISSTFLSCNYMTKKFSIVLPYEKISIWWYVTTAFN